MNEKNWVALVVKLLEEFLKPNIQIHQGKKLVYAHEILSFENDHPKPNKMSYETDILITEHSNGVWKPRLIVECKINSVTTHDAITYSQKALSHKNVFPYLRYGILIGNRKHYPLPGRLYRHGAYFDFMQSWVDFEPSKRELNHLAEIIQDEVKSSQLLEEILYSSRKFDRRKFTSLRKPLILENIQ